MREGWKEERIALLNRLRGLLGEFGAWPERSSDKLIRALPSLSEDERLPSGMRAIGIETRERRQERLSRCATPAAGESQPPAAMDHRRIWPSGLPQGPGGDCQQARPHDLGDAGQR